MKKIVGIIAAAALAASAFAEINIGSWNRGAFVPFAYDGDDVRALEGANWDGTNSTSYGVRTGLSFSADADGVAGISFDVFGSSSGGGAELGVGDNAYVWVKPVDMLTVKFGQIDNNWGRQDVCFGMWDHTWRFGGNLSVGEGVAAWRDHYGTGVELTLQPVEGLVIDYQGGFGAGNEYAYKTLYHHSDVMVGYTASDIGFFRAIVAPQTPAANYDGDDKEWMTIGLAADVWAVENLNLSFGVTIPTLFDKAASSRTDTPVNIPVGVGAAYSLDALTIHGLARFNLYGTENDDADGNEFGKLFGLYLGAGVDYAINDMFTLIADVRFFTYLGDSDYVDAAQDGGDFGVYLGLAQNLAGATFDFGVQLTQAKTVSGAGNTGVSSVDDSVTFAVPLMITVGF